MSTHEKVHVVRKPSREVHEIEVINDVLDSEYVAHVGFVDSETKTPFVIPMGYARDGDRILLHGSTGGRMMMEIAKGADLCITVTKLHAIVAARSAFNSSMNYQSVMIFGKATVLDGQAKNEALGIITNKLVPGLWEYGREMKAKEAAATMMVSVLLDQVSMKARSGEPGDDEEDMGLPIWAGLLPLQTIKGAPITTPTSVVKEVPVSIAKEWK